MLAVVRPCRKWAASVPEREMRRRVGRGACAVDGGRAGFVEKKRWRLRVGGRKREQVRQMKEEDFGAGMVTKRGIILLWVASL